MLGEARPTRRATGGGPRRIRTRARARTRARIRARTRARARARARKGVLRDRATDHLLAAPATVAPATTGPATASPGLRPRGGGFSIGGFGSASVPFDVWQLTLTTMPVPMPTLMTGSTGRPG